MNGGVFMNGGVIVFGWLAFLALCFLIYMYTPHGRRWIEAGDDYYDYLFEKEMKRIKRREERAKKKAGR
ncbi:hypothetical protein Barb7_00353 [Bacteroidales bacterium Barb7]|nr:hypothetical protein Barb6XT_00969 [Bacteroidales bacterium Barb6XT]OAV72173.1 hypothetical protein Barb4_00106 [Bacteroidales bacterium Barb4]OAV75989.1 hypothetical protein Barb7_00353 [Bacteroidales bacterium Barb7]